MRKDRVYEALTYIPPLFKRKAPSAVRKSAERRCSCDLAQRGA
jgi:hypothetical protein